MAEWGFERIQLYEAISLVIVAGVGENCRFSKGIVVPAFAL